jgi:hypothetical protein
MCANSGTPRSNEARAGNAARAGLSVFFGAMYRPPLRETRLAGACAQAWGASCHVRIEQRRHAASGGRHSAFSPRLEGRADMGQPTLPLRAILLLA